MLVFPAALCSGLGRVTSIYHFWALCFALIPGLPGDYIRIAYYHLTLEQCPLNSRIQFGSFFVHPQVRVGHHVYIGGYCIVGRSHIGDRTHIASGVQILSGRNQHSRDAAGHIQGADSSSFETISIGDDCWIGAGSILMAGLGDQTTIGAGSVVVQPIAGRSTAVGVPARVLENKS